MDSERDALAASSTARAPAPRFEQPSEAQRERAAAARLAGQMKPGQHEDYWKRLLVLEGVAPARLDEVLAVARRERIAQVRRRQAPLRPLAVTMMVFGLLGVAALPLLLLADEASGRLITAALLLFGAGGFLFYRGLRLHRTLRAEDDASLELNQPSLWRERREPSVPGRTAAAGEAGGWPDSPPPGGEDERGVDPHPAGRGPVD